MARRSVVRAIHLFGASLILLGSIPAFALAAQPGGGSGPGPKAAAPIKQRLDRIRAAVATHRLHAPSLMQIPDVVGSALGVAPDGEPAIRVFTARHRVPGIPAALDGVAVRPEVSGRFYALRGPTCNASGDEACNNAERWPLPVPTGVSVGHPAITAGTIGARVTKDGNVFVLSNNHVLANVNQGIPGDPILQPGSFDGGANPADAIASLTEFEPIKFCTVYFIWIICQQTNSIDAAIAQTTTGALGFATPAGEYGSGEGYGAPSSVLHPAYGNPTVIGDENLALLLGQAVQKYGRTTGRTVGTVDGVNATLDVCYDSACARVGRFANQLVISPGGFSGGGDSGSLIVTNDSAKNPVGLLFAGSSSNTIANRIDLVLNRFGVTIDEGTVVTPGIDVAATGVAAPPGATVEIETTVTVTVENRGQQAAAGVRVTLLDNGGLVDTMSVDLPAGASTTVDFLWTPETAGARTLEARVDLSGDENPANDTVTQVVNVAAPGDGSPQLQLRRVVAYTNQWTTVQLGVDYGTEMVVVCSPSYDLSAPGPALVRVRNASGSSFQVGLGRPWYGAYAGDDFSATVHCMVVREGVYSAAQHGVKMEAVKVPNFTPSDHAGAWSGQSRPYAAGYNIPVVLGQVVSPDTGLLPSSCTPICQRDWSVFWSRGSAVTNPPSSGALYVGRHTGEDRTGRPPETLMYVVIESGAGSIQGHAYVAARGADTIRGMSNRPPFTYSLSGLPSASTAIVSLAGMDAGDGGWPVLYGAVAVSATQLRLAIDEDWYLYSERNHTTEQVAYIVFQ